MKVYLLWENEQRRGYDRHDLVDIYALEQDAERRCEELNTRRPNSDIYWEVEEWGEVK